MALATGRIVGQFVLGVVDGPDVDQEPDIIPAQGTVTFSGAAPYIPLVDAVPNPVTLMTTSVVAVLDSEGYLCAPDPFDPTKPGQRGVRLFANDDPSSPVQGWTWTVTYRFAVTNGATPTIPAHSIAVLSGTELDLTTVVKVPASPGIGVDQAFALVAQAQAAAQVALDVKAQADAGEFDGTPGAPGAPGAPGNATMRIDTSVGNRVFVTNGVTERMVVGDTGWRDISATVNAASGLTATVARIRRIGYEVQVEVLLPTAAPATGSISLGNFPTGFRGSAGAAGSRAIGTRGAVPAIFLVASNGSASIVQTASGTSEVNAFVSYSTTDAWPASLPGTAVGTIPTL